MMTKQPQFVSVTEAAEFVGVSTGYLRKLLRGEKIPGVKIGPRAWVIPTNQLEKLSAMLDPNQKKLGGNEKNDKR